MRGTLTKKNAGDKWFMPLPVVMQLGKSKFARTLIYADGEKKDFALTRPRPLDTIGFHHGVGESLIRDEMVTGEYRVRIPTRDFLDWSCFGSWNKRQMHLEIALCRRIDFDVSLDRKFHGGLHTGIVSCRLARSRISRSTS